MPIATMIAGLQYRLVGIADLAVSNEVVIVLGTQSLGSCLGVAVYDPDAHVGGLCHAMLPDSRLSPDKALAQPGMFLDTAVPTLLKAVRKLGGEAERLRVFAAGGAEIADASEYFAVGKQNRESLETLCEQYRLQIQGRQFGGQTSCSLYLGMAHGDVWIKFCGQMDVTYLCKNSTTT